MSSRRNFLDADNSIMERNLRFVKNDLEENFNQYFGGSSNRGNNFNNISAPPRDYKVVQPKPGGTHDRGQSNGLETRKEFLLKLGLPRHEAYVLAKNTEFDVNRLKQMYYEYVGRGTPHENAISRILCDIRNQDHFTEGNICPERNNSRERSPFTSRYYEEQGNSTLDHREYKGNRNRSRSRSHSPPYVLSTNDQGEERYQPRRSITPNRYLTNFERRDTVGEHSNSRTHFQITIDHKEEYNRSLGLRSPNRTLSLMGVKREEYFSQQDNFDSDVGISTLRGHPECYSPARIDPEGGYYHSLRSRSPNIPENDGEGHRYMYDINMDEGRRDDVMREPFYQRNLSPPRNVSREDSFNRPRSPYVQLNDRKFEQHMHDTNMDEEEGRAARGQYHQRSYSPPGGVCDGEPFNSAVPRSSYRGFTLKGEEPLIQPDNFRDDSRIHSIRERSRSYSPSKFNRRGKKLPLSRSPSPNTWSRPKGDYIFLQDNIRDEIRRGLIRGRSLSRSPPKIDQKQTNYNLSRSPSPPRGFRGTKFEVKPDDFRNKINALRQSRIYSQIVNNSNSSITRLANSTFTSRNDGKNEDNSSSSYNIRNNNFADNLKRDSRTGTGPVPPQKFDSVQKSSNNSTRFNFEQKNQSMTNQNIPSLLSLNVFANQGKNSAVSSQKRNIPSLLSLKHNDFPQPSTSKKSNQHNQKPSNDQLHRNMGNEGKFMSNRKKTQIEKINENSKCISRTPIIASGMGKPLSGHLKANPRDYWSRWWPHYKYIEYSITKIDPSDYEVQRCIHFLFERDTDQYQKRCRLLLSRGIKDIMKTEYINETNYFLYPIVKLFEYKKHLEDPTFQNSLNAAQLNLIAPALRQFQIRPTMALLHQALIVKWDKLFDIMKQTNVPNVRRPKSSKTVLQQFTRKPFHYLVMESIQELKKMCQHDWPQFNEFYQNLKAEKVDVSAIANNSTVYKSINRRHGDAVLN